MAGQDQIPPIPAWFPNAKSNHNFADLLDRDYYLPAEGNFSGLEPGTSTPRKTVAFVPRQSRIPIASWHLQKKPATPRGTGNKGTKAAMKTPHSTSTSASSPAPFANVSQLMQVAPRIRLIVATPSRRRSPHHEFETEGPEGPTTPPSCENSPCAPPLAPERPRRPPVVAPVEEDSEEMIIF